MLSLRESTRINCASRRSQQHVFDRLVKVEINIHHRPPGPSALTVGHPAGCLTILLEPARRADLITARRL